LILHLYAETNHAIKSLGRILVPEKMSAIGDIIQIKRKTEELEIGVGNARFISSMVFSSIILPD